MCSLRFRSKYYPSPSLYMFKRLYLFCALINSLDGRWSENVSEHVKPGRGISSLLGRKGGVQEPLASIYHKTHNAVIMASDKFRLAAGISQSSVRALSQWTDRLREGRDYFSEVGRRFFTCPDAAKGCPGKGKWVEFKMESSGV